MKNKLITTTLITIMAFSLAACTKAKKEEGTEQPAAGEEDTSATETTGTDQISMLDHLKAVNAKLCAAMAGQNPEKTAEQCTEELNKISEMNPNNKTTQVSKARSDTCLGALTGEGDLMAKSVEGPCALPELQAAQ